jgi:N utilization substance protein A
VNTALLSALHEIETEKGIPFETVKGVLEESLLAAYEGREGAEEDARVVLDEETGDLRVVKEGEDITPHDFTRIAAQVMRQTFYQRLNEVHNEQLMAEYGDRVGKDVVTGIVQQAHRRMTLVDLGQVEAILPASEQVPNERYENGQRLKVFLLEIREGGRGPSLTVSRRHEALLRNLFELEVPEIYDGLVEIRAVAREAGLRSKVAVWSKEAGVDPVGACVGPRGSRVRAVVSELRNEKIDIIQWDPEPARFIAKALSPARVREVYLDEDEKQAEVIVPDDREADGLEDRHKAREPGDGVRGRGRGLGARRGLHHAPLQGGSLQRPQVCQHGAARLALLRHPVTPGAGRRVRGHGRG